MNLKLIMNREPLVNFQKNKSIIILFSLFFYFPVLFYSCSEPVNDFDLGFECRTASTSPWFCEQKNAISGYTTVDFVEGKSCFSMLHDKNAKPFFSALYQTIYVPGKEKELKVSIKAKSVSVENAWLKVYCMDVNDNLISKDSVSILSEEKWDHFELNVPATDFQKLYLEIVAASQPNPYDVKSILEILKRGEKIPYNKLLIDNISVNINGKSLSSYLKVNPFEQDPYESKVKLPEFIHAIELLTDLPEIKNHSIIAFGEAVHGSRQIQEAALNSIVNLIKYDNCRLVLLELPFSLGLRLNGYILGETVEDVENLLIFNNLDIISFKYFLDWVKEYNLRSPVKVNIVGIDEEKKLLSDDNLDIFLRKIIKNDTTAQIVNDCLNRKDYSRAKYIIKNQLLGDNYHMLAECVVHEYQLREENSTFNQNSLISKREKVLFYNTEFALETFAKGNTKTAIFTHLGHVDKKNSVSTRIYNRNFGSYMSQKFPEEYFVIALTVGNGTITSFGENGFESKFKLIDPPNGSIEKKCLQLQKNRFYTEASNINNVYYGRFIGANFSNKQFLLYTPAERFDGLIFISKTDNNRLPKSWPKKTDDIKNYINDSLKNNG